MPLIKKVQIGRVVAYVLPIDSQGTEVVPNVNPAIITRVHDDKTVDLFVMHSNGNYSLKSVSHGGDEERGSWHWLRLLDDPNG